MLNTKLVPDHQAGEIQIDRDLLLGAGRGIVHRLSDISQMVTNACISFKAGIIDARTAVSWIDYAAPGCIDNLLPESVLSRLRNNQPLADAAMKREAE
ncbi:MAG TPA: hypothetical protein VNQ56_16035 [Pseudolabrys sp.]|nr:hypothetical protein [Pseudolabrys sp.]